MAPNFGKPQYIPYSSPSDASLQDPEGGALAQIDPSEGLLVQQQEHAHHRRNNREYRIYGVYGDNGEENENYQIIADYIFGLFRASSHKNSIRSLMPKIAGAVAREACLLHSPFLESALFQAASPTSKVLDTPIKPKARP